MGGGAAACCAAETSGIWNWVIRGPVLIGARSGNEEREGEEEDEEEGSL